MIFLLTYMPFVVTICHVLLMVFVTVFMLLRNSSLTSMFLRLASSQAAFNNISIHITCQP